MDERRADVLARQFFDANRGRAQYLASPESLTALPLEDAYQVQDAFNRLQTADGVGKAIGYKIALTSKAMQDFIGVSHPLVGVVYESRLHSSPVTRSLASYQHIGVEFEVTVRLGQALPAGDTPHTRESVADAVV